MRVRLPAGADPWRSIPLAGMALLCAASWAWLVHRGSAMGDMDMGDMAMPATSPWALADVAALLAMWAVMMVAMMLPSVAPVVLLYRRVVPARAPGASPALMTGLFLAGYLVAWLAFAVLATLAQAALHAAALVSSAAQLAAPAIAGAVLVVAGAYQWSPQKHACLRQCRSPLAFLLNAWRPGRAGAFAMGASHGLWCTGCCWLLMAILFVVGVMNLAWVAAIALLILAEKVLPHGDWLARLCGVALVAWGGVLLLA